MPKNGPQQVEPLPRVHPEPPMIADSRPSVRSELRSRTAQVHARLERIPLVQAILRGEASLSSYGRMLHAYRQYYARARFPLAAGYAELAGMGLHAPAHAPLGLIEDDLHALGEPLVPVDETPPMFTTAGAVGWVWVSEGSALGAILIDRSLDSLFTQQQRAGRRFFQAAPDHALRWRAVCESIEYYGRENRTRDAVVEGALHAFDGIERSLLRTRL